MSRARLIAAGIVAVMLVGLYVWQQRRERLIEACLEQQGLWDGSACKPDPYRIRIQRDLHRT